MPASEKKAMLPILRGWFNQFCDEWYDKPVINSKDEDLRFEAFSNFYVINTYQRSNEPPASFCTNETYNDPADDRHIDGVGVFINGKFCASEESVADFAERNESLDVTVHFLQAKNGSKCIDSGDLQNFLAGARDFLDETPWGAGYSEVSDTLVEAQKIFASCFNHGLASKPKVHMHWCVSSRDDAEHFANDVASTFSRALSDLERAKQDLVASIDFTFYGAVQLIRRVENFSASNECTVKIPYANRVDFPSEEDSMSSSFFAFVEGEEFLKIIAPGGTLDTRIFSENVRDFQGENTDAYRGMSATLSDPDQRPEFAVRNNGITVIAESIAGSSMCTLKNYQVVNGCQSSNALYNHRDSLEGVYVPVRFVQVSDEEFLDRITYSTNSQNEVKPADMVSRSKLARELERHCSRPDVKDPIAFERRVGQFLTSPAPVPKNRILQKKDFTSAYVACVLGRPHHAIGYYDRYMSGKKDDIWSSDEPAALLYACGYLANRIFRARLIPSEFLALKYHILWRVFHSAWTSFDHDYTQYKRADSNAADHARSKRRLETGISRVIASADHDSELRQRVESAVLVAKRLTSLPDFAASTKNAKIPRSQTKKENSTLEFRRLSSSIETHDSGDSSPSRQ